MNLMKLNNESRNKSNLAARKLASTIKEERRRTGRYIAILVGICLFLLAIYHAWVRRIPVVASLVVPALIMFVYVGWVLYTAARDKQKFLLLDAEAALNAATADGVEAEVLSSEAPNNIEISITSSPETPKTNLPENLKHKEWAKISTAFINGEKNNRVQEDSRHHILPIILVNDRPPDDLDQTWVQIIETLTNSEKFKNIQTRRKFKRRFCRSRRYAAFKRSYSIA